MVDQLVAGERFALPIKRGHAAWREPRDLRALAGARRIARFVEHTRTRQLAEVMDREDAGGQFVVKLGEIDRGVNAFVHQQKRARAESQRRRQAVQVGGVDAKVVPGADLPCPMQRCPAQVVEADLIAPIEIPLRCAV